MLFKGETYREDKWGCLTAKAGELFFPTVSPLRSSFPSPIFFRAAISIRSAVGGRAQHAARPGSLLHQKRWLLLPWQPLCVHKHIKLAFTAVCISCNCGVLLKALSSNLASKPSPLFRYLGQRPKWRKRDKSFRGGVWGETLLKKGSLFFCFANYWEIASECK